LRRDLAIIITARMNSDRLPGKAMAEVAGKPMIYWITRRLQAVGNTILDITTDPTDDILDKFGHAMGVPVSRSKAGDVVSSMNAALNYYAPDSKYVMRGLCDCPFNAVELIEHMCRTMDKFGGDAFQWALPPQIAPVYGSREFPYSRRGWETIVKNSTTREHVDPYYHQHRNEFNTLYHEPPPNVYMRPYRLEVDYPEDLELIRGIAAKVSMLSSVQTVIKTLDSDDKLAQTNRMRVEKTGLSTYSYDVKRSWVKDMEGKAIVDWEGNVWKPIDSKSIPVFCDGGTCLLGQASHGSLYLRDGSQITGDARIACNCGAGKRWKARK